MENNTKELLISHLFNAPVKQVVDAWTTREHLENWYAPDGCAIEFKSLDVRKGGGFHSCIHDPVHGNCWIKGEYMEVSTNRLVFSMILSNEEGDTTTAIEAGKAEEWPQAIVTTVTFTPIGESQTKVILHQTVAESEAKKTGAYQSWFSMFERLNNLISNPEAI